MSKTNIFSTPEHYEAPVCETIDMMVEMNFLRFRRTGKIKSCLMVDREVLVN